MSKNRIKDIGLLAFLICICFPSLAQDKPMTTDSTKTGSYSLNVFAGGGGFVPPLPFPFPQEIATEIKERRKNAFSFKNIIQTFKCSRRLITK